MKTLTKTQKIENWAGNAKERTISKLKKELNYTTEKQVLALLNKMQRQKRITFFASKRTSYQLMPYRVR